MDDRLWQRQREYWAAGDERRRCEVALHLVCERCGVCACDVEAAQAPEFPNGVIRVTTDKDKRTWCRECRYQADYLGNW